MKSMLKGFLKAIGVITLAFVVFLAALTIIGHIIRKNQSSQKQVWSKTKECPSCKNFMCLEGVKTLVTGKQVEVYYCHTCKATNLMGMGK